MAINLMTIKEAAVFLGVSIDTLRRWDRSGRLKTERTRKGGHRRYDREELTEFITLNCAELAKKWAKRKHGVLPNDFFYCPDSYVFQGRLYKIRSELDHRLGGSGLTPLLVAITGEIGDNSFAHNLGNWPDTAGVFFGWNMKNKKIVLADRGLGVFTTLKRVKPEIGDDKEALKVAFTEIISGRAPENRGNGLKFVRNLVENNPIGLYFQSGQAELSLAAGQKDLIVKSAKSPIRGCLAIIKF